MNTLIPAGSEDLVGLVSGSKMLGLGGGAPAGDVVIAGMGGAEAGGGMGGIGIIEVEVVIIEAQVGIIEAEVGITVSVAVVVRVLELPQPQELELLPQELPPP